MFQHRLGEGGLAEKEAYQVQRSLLDVDWAATSAWWASRWVRQTRPCSRRWAAGSRSSDGSSRAAGSRSAAAFEIIGCCVACSGPMPTVYEIIADNAGSAAFVSVTFASRPRRRTSSASRCP